MNAAAQNPDIRESDRIAFLRLRGSLDEKTVFSFKKSVFNVPATKKVLVLDLNRLDHVSNIGLGTMIDAFRYFRKRGGRVFLVQPGEELQLLLRHFKATDLCTLVQSYDEIQDHIQMQSSVESSDSPFLDTDQEGSPTGHGSPVVHHHYYGRRSDATKRKHVDPEMSGDAGTLHALNQTLARLEQTLNGQHDGLPGSTIDKIERVDSRLDDIRRGENRLSERLDSLEKNLNRAFEERIDRLEAHLVDQLDPRSSATSLSTRSAASSFPGTRMIECRQCHAVLRVKQSGRHLCPSCKTEFTVDVKGRPSF